MGTQPKAPLGCSPYPSIRVAARFLSKSWLFLTIFEYFPDLKINKFLARNWVLLETRPYIVKSLFPNEASGAFFPDNDLMEVFRTCLTVFVKFYSSTGHQSDRSLTMLTLLQRSRGTQRKMNWSSIIESPSIMQATYTDQSSGPLL